MRWRDHLTRPATAWHAVLLLTAVSVMIRVGGDRWWFMLPVLLGPRWPWMLALILTIPPFAHSPRRAVVPTTLALAIAMYGVLGARLGPARMIRGPERDVRVLALNAGGRPEAVTQLMDALSSLGVDIAVVVECPAQSAVARKGAYEMRAHGEICVLSRLPIIRVRTHPGLGVWRPDGNDAALIVDAATGAGTLAIAAVHLETPRDALEQFLGVRSALRAKSVVDSQTAVRRRESAAIRHWIRSQGKVDVVAGDFNLTVESSIYRADWSDLSNAFDHAGIGLGHTFTAKWWGVRIDHILAASTVRVTQARVGPDLGSDHRPVVTDLMIR